MSALDEDLLVRRVEELEAECEQWCDVNEANRKRIAELEAALKGVDEILITKDNAVFLVSRARAFIHNALHKSDR